MLEAATPRAGAGPETEDARLQQSWRAQGLWRDETLDQAFARTAAAAPDARLTLCSEVRPAVITAGELRRQALAAAGALHALGCRAGDTVAIQLPHWLEGAVLYQAAAAVGCVILPIIPIYGAAELTFILADSRAKALFIPSVWRGHDFGERIAKLGATPDLRAIVAVGGEAPKGAIAWERFLDRAQPFAAQPVSPMDVAFMVYTSGTTAAPKGVRHHANNMVSEIVANTRGRDFEQRVLSPYPAGHVAGALSILGHAIAGRTTVVFDQWNPKLAAQLIEAERITSTSGTPFHYMGLLDAAEAGGCDLSSLIECGGGGATVPEALVERAERAGIHWFHRYGLSEHPTVTEGNSRETLEERKTDGRPNPGNEVRIVDDDGAELPVGVDGEIATRGPERFIGYTDERLNRESFLPGGWFRTGDIGNLDARGYLTITDRKKDIIIRGGENISSREVEDLVMRVPGVLEVAAVSMPDPRLGETICAFVLTRAGVQISVETVDRAFREFGVARQKTPERVIVVDDFPRTASGKVRKAELRARLTAAAHPVGSPDAG